MKCRGESGEKSRAEHGERRKKKDPHVDGEVQLERPRHRRWHRVEDAHAPCRNEQGDRTGKSTEDQTLDNQLLHESQPRRSDGETRRDFTPEDRRACEEHSGGVRRGDEEHHARDREQHRHEAGGCASRVGRECVKRFDPRVEHMR